MPLVVMIGTSLLVSCVVQGNPPLVVSSPALSMIVPALILSTTSPADRSLNPLLRIVVAAVELLLMLIATLFISGSIKVCMLLELVKIMNFICP